MSAWKLLAAAYRLLTLPQSLCPECPAKPRLFGAEKTYDDDNDASHTTLPATDSPDFVRCMIATSSSELNLKQKRQKNS